MKILVVGFEELNKFCARMYGNLIVDSVTSTVQSVEEAIKIYKRLQPEMIIMDCFLPLTVADWNYYNEKLKQKKEIDRQLALLKYKLGRNQYDDSSEVIGLRATRLGISNLMWSYINHDGGIIMLEQLKNELQIDKLPVKVLFMTSTLDFGKNTPKISGILEHGHWQFALMPCQTSILNDKLNELIKAP